MGSAEIRDKDKVIAKYKVHEKDTGSPEVQIALLTKRLEVLSEHLKRNPQDIHSQRGMYGMVNRRKSLLSFLRRESVDRYRNTINSLNLRK